MNDPLPTLVARSTTTAECIHHHADKSIDFRISPEALCSYKAAESALWVTMAPRGIPCFSPGLLRDLEHASRVVEGYFAAPSAPHLAAIVLRSGARGAFNVGGDLGYFQRLISQQDRAGLTDYARAAINVAYRNYVAHDLPGVTTIALLEGTALGGGFEAALSCNYVIAERHVKAGFPEVLFDMFPGMGALSFLTRRVGNRRVINDLTRSGRQFDAQELYDLGVIDAVVDTGDGAAAVLRLLRQREHQQAAHGAMNLVDRMIHPVTLQELHEVVRMWVDCAINLSPRGLAWMRRLHQQQQAAFGNRLTMVPGIPMPLS
jgi:DSF synthase